MKIACLQFAPQVGDIDNNLNRADAILNRAKAADLEDLDLLVLPELAFSGYNFHSLQQISPYLEPPGSGISSLWARTTALKYDCAVVVGYPEKVDVTKHWPASPEYYNSALIVNGDGETIGNYRKSFLYYTDETWALEGKHGFYHGRLPGIGSTALGICMDLNPYKFEADWDAFEFGFHVLEVQANIVIMSMAWHTQEDSRLFSRSPKEPDIETLVYWVQRLEPLIRAEGEDEIIVVFCNRTGTEEEVTYAGTSAVIGIKGGEVFVYGVLGRGVKDVLVVDTNAPPISKLAEVDGCETGFTHAEETAEDLESGPIEAVPEIEIIASTPYDEVSAKEDLTLQPMERGAGPEPLPDWPMSPMSPAFQLPTEQNEQTDQPQNAGKKEKPFPRLQIPYRPSLNEQPSIDSALMDDIIIESPDDEPNYLASPVVQLPVRPRLVIPSSPWRFHKKPSPYPWQPPETSRPALFGGKVAMTPITPFDIDTPWRDTPISTKAPHPPSFAWRPLQRTEDTPAESARTPGSSLSKKPSVSSRFQRTFSPESPKALPFAVQEQEIRLDPETEMDFGDEEDLEPEPELNQTFNQEQGRDQELKRGQAEEPKEEELGPGPLEGQDWGELSVALEGLKTLERRPSSALDNPRPSYYEPPQSPCPDRPGSPKSRNASRNRNRPRSLQIPDPVSSIRELSLSRGSIPISASPSIWDADFFRPQSTQSIQISASPSLFGREDANDPSPPVAIERPVSRVSHRIGPVPAGKRRTSLNGGNGRSLSLPGVQEQEEPRTPIRSSSIAAFGGDNGESFRRRPRSLLRHSITARSDEQGRKTIAGGSRIRAVSRGRQPAARGTSVERSNSIGERKVQASRRRSVQKQKRTTSMITGKRQSPFVGERSISVGAGDVDDLRGLRLSADSDDEIIAIVHIPSQPGRQHERVPSSGRVAAESGIPGSAGAMGLGLSMPTRKTSSPRTIERDLSETGGAGTFKKRGVSLEPGRRARPLIDGVSGGGGDNGNDRRGFWLSPDNDGMMPSVHAPAPDPLPRGISAPGMVERNMVNAVGSDSSNKPGSTLSREMSSHDPTESYLKDAIDTKALTTPFSMLHFRNTPGIAETNSQDAVGDSPSTLPDSELDDEINHPVLIDAGAKDTIIAHELFVPFSMRQHGGSSPGVRGSEFTLPLRMPPFAQSLVHRELLSAGSSVSTLDNSPGPLTPGFLLSPMSRFDRKTPEPMILSDLMTPNSAVSVASPRAKIGMETFGMGMKSHDGLPATPRSKLAW